MNLIRTFVVAVALLQAMLSFAESALAQTVTREQYATLSKCVDEGSEYVKSGLFFSLDTDKESVLRPPRFPTGTPEERRREIVNETYDRAPKNYRVFAQDSFLRCASAEPSVFKNDTLEYCFRRQARIVELYIARDGGMTEANIIAAWSNDSTLSPRALESWRKVINNIYSDKTSLREMAFWYFVGCAIKRESN